MRSPRTVPAPSSHLFLNAPKHVVDKSKKIHQSSHLAIRRSWPCRRWRRRGRRWCSLLFPTWYELKTTSILGAAVRPAQPEHLEEEGDGSEEEEPQGGCEEEQEDEDCGIDGGLSVIVEYWYVLLCCLLSNKCDCCAHNCLLVRDWSVPILSKGWF